MLFPVILGFFLTSNVEHWKNIGTFDPDGSLTMSQLQSTSHHECNVCQQALL